MTDYRDKLFVITGAAGGMGRALAPLLLGQGARLLLNDVHVDGLAELAGALDAGARVATAVSPLDSLAACRDVVAATDGPIHALVHLAGIMEMDPLDGSDDRQMWHQVIDANLTNAHDMVAACLPRLADDPADPGRIVLLSSMAYRRGAPEFVAYTVAKGGLAGMVRALSRRLAPGVLVNGLAPGIIDTGLPDKVIALRGEQILKGIPLARWGEAEEVTSVIDFLCGPGSTYITGQIINVDGGVINS